MPNNAITPQRLEEARQKIVDLFVTHCTYGAQTGTLQDATFAACGQFLGDSARSLSQRGMHGTSAAISVLSRAKTTDHQLLGRLIRYATDRRTAEAASESSSRIPDDHIAADDSNVIKMSELLLALSHVPASTVTNVERLRRVLVDRLKSSVVEAKGWRYFSDLSSGEIELLPTAYAMMALAAFDEDISGPHSYLLDQLKKPAPYDHSAADVTTRIAVLYTLVFHKHAGRDARSDSELSKECNDIWYQVDRQLRDDHVEQNIEYWREGRTFYVRVPWQLYLLAVTAKIAFYNRFCTHSSQLRLRAIVDELITGHFRYPHSGAMVSSRTNATAHEILFYIQDELARRPIVSTLVWIDWIRSSSLLRYFIAALVVALVGWSGWKWWKDGSIADLAPEFIGALVSALALWTRRR